MVTEAEIESAKTKNGGWTKKTLEAWGVPWPPPNGWKKMLLSKGSPKTAEQLRKPKQKKLTSLQGTLGAYGVRTNNFKTREHQICAAKILFELPGDLDTKADVLAAINQIPKKTRWHLSLKNRAKLRSGRS